MTYATQTWADAPSTSTPITAARLAHIETGVSNALDKTETGTQTVSGGITLAAEKRITLSANAATGSVSRLIELRATDIVDRPWVSWFDQNARHVATTGAHDTLNASEGGTQLKQFEIKTIADATGSNPAELRTRLAIQYDVQRGTWGVNFVDNFEINQGENPILTTPGSVTQFGLRLRTAPQDTFSGALPNAVVGVFSAQLDASDNTSVYIDAKPPYTSGGSLFPGNKTATLNIFRNTTTASASSPQIAVKLGDGTNTNALVFTAKSGLFELPLALSTTTGVKLGGDANATLYRSATSTIASAGKITASLGLGCGNSASATAVGSLSKKMEVFDTAGASLGFVPIYTTIT